jgi:hypothetical protein
LAADHEFNVVFDEQHLDIAIDDFSSTFEVAKMPKVLGRGLVRFQAAKSWMTLIDLDIEERRSV